ncbi:HAD family hydrolase [Paenibacillus cookii]|uniref:Phosphatase n=1 Tax=Paenibacillus cookii TaxID=157839 RepID=A0ABQ4LSX6_9BACL|nr:HAD family phosphatase [Paenibacillus cookii]GIO66362.1 phosphatase [Paenibacillus cookii]
MITDTLAANALSGAIKDSSMLLSFMFNPDPVKAGTRSGLPPNEQERTKENRRVPTGRSWRINMEHAFIFDMDGVIIDSEPIHFDVDIRTLSHFGVETNEQELERFVGMTNPEMLGIFKQERNLPHTVEEMIEYQLNLKMNILKNLEIEPIAGVVALMEQLRGMNIPMAVASSSPRVFIEGVLGKFGLSRFFKTVVSGEEVPKGKPAPDIYLETAKQLGVQPQHCVVLEDSRNGMLAAKTAGMRCIGYLNPNSGNQDLAEADLQVRSYDEIPVRELFGNDL